ncbi:MAG: OmpA family protein [Gemmatimonadaceae bacterium]
MSARAFTLGLAALLAAVPAAAQRRGTMEFGAFGSAASFDNDLGLKTAYGGGGRIGMYLEPRLSIEFEDAEMRATRTNGLKDVNVGILSGRLVAVPVRAGAFSILLGAGAGVSTETNFMHTYGVDALAGFKVDMGERAALRVDGVWDWLANENWKQYRSVRVGISLYRHPRREVRTVTVRESAIPDTAAASALRRLRDSLARAPQVPSAPMRTGPSAATVATMEARIHFAYDQSGLTDSARAILDEKVPLFHAAPDMAVVIVGHTDQFGSDAYNMALGQRRAAATKAYLVGRGIDANRIYVESRGEREPVTDAAGITGQAPNRRAVFRLLLVPDGGARR